MENAEQTISEPKKILLAEDNPVNQKYVAITLRKKGYLVDIANNGFEAITLLATNTYQLILMDCGMPFLDGYETTQKIRSGELGEAIQHIPIVAVTAFAMPLDRQKCLDTGMTDYVSKPVSAIDLLAIVHKYCPL